MSNPLSPSEVDAIVAERDCLKQQLAAMKAARDALLGECRYNEEKVIPELKQQLDTARTIIQQEIDWLESLDLSIHLLDRVEVLWEQTTTLRPKR